MTVLTRPDGPQAEDVRVSRRTVGALGGLLFGGYAVAALAQEAHPITTSGEGLVEETVRYSSPDGFELPAFVARPQGEGPFPLIVVVSEIFGVHEYIRDVCRRLAREGYAAIAPAFFVRVEDPAPLSDVGRIMQIVSEAKYEQVMGDIAATLDWASRQGWAGEGKAGITGFCWGGKVVWQACARFAAFGAGAAWYGRLAPSPDASTEQIASGRPWPVDLAEDLKSPVLGLYGGRDQGIPLPSVEAMRANLARAGQSGSEIVLYPDAPHGFHADYRPSYRQADAVDGWRKMLALFSKTLKS
ncbi:dienelactone hydrolase family protein [Brevundimonas sp. PAMC22021]|uniref:dienelactone hydrolase family protein n=1 Tax=Brevundimonas sp. PAMC22021 TaxID=2861285 RepID=UPI001C631DB4|nr:dienelactone hydrolase family protein [Brevundimonas sp. PAMC22021]QYF86508.1 dienelactone hydrolase family protein [Brevundimonas sp. PAMC22021]